MTDAISKRKATPIYKGEKKENNLPSGLGKAEKSAKPRSEKRHKTEKGTCGL